MKFRLQSTIALVALAMIACNINVGPLTVTRGSGNVISESRTVSDFSAVTFAGIGDMTVIQGETESLVIEAEDNILPLIEVEVRDGTLHIGIQASDWRDTVLPTRPIRYTLTIDDLDRLALSGLGNIRFDRLQAEDFTLVISGAGNVSLGGLEAASVTVQMSGAGNADLSGRVNAQVVTITGAGNYQAGDLESRETVITTSGLGNAILWVHDSLNVTITGAGSVDYYGSPQLTERITGLGRVNPQGDK